MTDQEINVAVAECCGWKIVRSGLSLTIGKDGKGACTGRHDHFDAIAGMIGLPNYCADLNAMHEVIMAIQWMPMQKLAFLAYLAHKRGDFDLVNATARQRAEAFLRTLGKWKE